MNLNGRCRDGGDISTVCCADKKAGGYMPPVFFYLYDLSASRVVSKLDL